MTPLRAVPLPRYPAVLRAQIAHVGRFVRALRNLEEAAAPGEGARVWLEGRAAEVVVFSVDVLEEWSKGETDTDVAARAIEEYLETLHAMLEGWYGEWYAPSCCGPLAAPRSETRPKSESRVRGSGLTTDTAVDAPRATMPTAADSPEEVAHALPFVHAMA